MKKIHFLLTLTIVLAGCNESSISSINRSVLQPIGEEEIIKLKNDYPNIST